ncbi:hypothetical protein AB0N79_39000 [Streptomyces microflavus]|uniref:LexA family protein n=1 Tax=Streptomyces microflavus TaxID=1919 RepID=UPI00344128FD
MRYERPLSVRQEAILRLIRSWTIEYGEGPTVRQMGLRVGLSSTTPSLPSLADLKRGV